MKLGSHISTRNGYSGAVQQAIRMGAQAFQYFPKNPRSLQLKKFDEKDAAHCAALSRQHGIISIAHTAYLINLSVEEQEMRQTIRTSLKNDLEITEACGSLGLVVHFGKYKGKDPLLGYKLMIEMLNEVLDDWMGQALILIENNAGQGVKMGTTLEELVQIRQLTDVKEKIGFCLDTCHAFASGLWDGTNWRDVAEKGRELGYFEHLKAIHLNDSAYKTSSFRDRHANIGKGYIGEEPFKELLGSEEIAGLPAVLETPESTGYRHQDEMKYIRERVIGMGIGGGN
ncbi:deoxyribonuclease IV [Ammoniphilus resinae]|uniref:Probable endonuclease 4 n=1 Tax=Ammoniphilus resinae TaxID=861532 RepID=A0ABS4GU71_9BACL|nr:deoxyribonuclease-4 [Ammoniphilus resinae]